MKITKSIGRLLLSFILLITMLPIDSMTVYANGDISGYSIILQPGDGSGSPISIHSRDDGRYYGESSNGSGVGNGQFFTMDGEIWFRCPDCPDSFTPPDGKVFAGWNNGVHSSGSFVKLTGDMTLTASWQNDGSVSIILTPDTITLNYDESGWIPFTVNISELNFGPNADDSSQVRIIFDSGGLSNSSGSIDFEIFSADHNDGGNELQWETKQTGLNEMALRIDPQALATALPGVYTGKLYYELSWYGIGIGQSTVPYSGFIPMTLVVPEPAVTKYTVSVTNGRVINGTYEGTYEEGESVTIKAAGPEDGLKSGLKFKNWTGTSGLNFTSGSATTSTATFVMPAADVKVKAVYETAPIGIDLYTLTLDANCDDVAGRSFPNLQSFTLPEFSHPEYVFEGWAETANGSVAYKGGQTITLTADKTLYAKWSGQQGNSLTLTLNPNYQGAAVDIYEKVTTMKLPSPTREGYIFRGWAEAANGSVVYKGGQTITLTADKTLYANWLAQSEESLIGNISPSDGGYVYLGGIRWRVIGESSDKMLLVSAGVLGGAMNWNDAKNYCDTVYNGFSDPEKRVVLDTTKTDTPYAAYVAVDLSNAKLFLMSASEVLTYFDSDADRQPGWWWLRSSNNETGAWLCGGVVHEAGERLLSSVNNDSQYGSRPAFVLNLSSVFFQSAAEGGKSSAAAGSGEFGSFSEGSGSDRKFTLLDSSRIGFGANVGGASSATVASGGTLALSYSGANTGTNEYVSAMICNSDGDILRYASLTPVNSGSGTWNMTIPDSLAEGSYTLKVFSEQQNGDKQTDYASTPVEISLTVSSAAQETVATPTFTPAGGIYVEAQNVTLSCTTDGAEIYYTTDGSDPTTGSTKYTGAITVGSTTTIKAIAVKSGMTNSSVASATYTFLNEASITATDKNYTFVPGATYDVSQMFSFGSGTGTPTYSIVTGENAGTGAGTLSGAQLTITKAGTIKIKVNTAATENVAAGEATAVLTVAKADAPKTKPSSTMTVAYSVDKVGSVSLPAGWTWVTSDKDKTLTAGEAIAVTAEYTAADKDYYNGGLTATVTITRQSKPSGGDSNNNSNAQSASVIPTVPVIPVIPINNDPEPVPQIPINTVLSRIIPDPGKPFIEGNPERSGWDAIKEDIQAVITNKEANSSADNTVMIDMDGSKKVPGDIISEIKGQDVTAVFDLGDGIKWSINGMDITGSDIKDIDLAVALDTNSIPGEVVTPLVGERYSRQISLAYEGDFGLTATLSVDMDAKNAGLFANLFYFNETKDELEFICANQIANDGIAELAFTHASDYVIVVDKEPMDGSFTEPEAHSENTVTGLGTQERTVESTLEETVSQSDARSPWRVIAICGAAIAIGLCAFYVIMKRKQ